MHFCVSIINRLLEADEDDFSVKDIAEPEAAPIAGKTQVKRFGRWKLVDMPGYTFLISFLTPVAYLDKSLGVYYETKKQWSPTTNGHIRDWRGMIWKSPEWKENPDNYRPSEHDPEGKYVTYPHFQRKRQSEISALFRQLLHSMKISSAAKRRLYHVDPKMRAGSVGQERARHYRSGHLKHKDSGEQGLPRPTGFGSDPYASFFQDFDPDDPEFWAWQQSDYRSQDPHETD
jgi:hypothetical protein